MSTGWAPFLVAAQREVFLTLVEAEVRRLGVAYRMGDGFVEVDAEDGPQNLGLSNLAQVCASAPVVDWPGIIKTHFDLVFGSVAEENALRSVVHDFEQVRSLLRIRLYESWIEDQVGRQLAPGLVAGLVFDLPSAMRSVSRSEADVWHRSDDDLFELALANLDLEEPTQQQVIHGPDEVPITVVEGSSYYTASRGLQLPKRVIPEGHPYGALLAVPSRHVFFYHLIEDSRVIYAVNALVSLAHEAFRRGPGAISDQVYWTRDGVLEAIPCGLEEGVLHVSPPARFVREVLERMAQPPS
jgi:hypothetical protein